MAAAGKKTISVALLVADTPVPPVVATYGNYERIFRDFLTQSGNTVGRHHWQEKLELNLRAFDVVEKQAYPDEGQLADGLWDCIMITGSASSAHADIPWTHKLVEFVRHVAEQHPLVRIIGICYGHQIIGRAFGAECRLNPKGWELGVYDADLTEEGRDLFDWDDEECSSKQVRLQQVHRDEVASVPPDFQGEEFLNLASTERTLVQALALKYPTEAPPLPSTAGSSAYLAFDVSDHTLSSSGPAPARSLHILSTQGHPEFNQDIVEKIMSVRSEMGVVQGELLEAGRKRAIKPHDGLRIGAVFLAMLGFQAAKDEGGTHFN